MLMKTIGLFAITAVAEILGCWLVLFAKQPGRSLAWLLPAAISLAAFAWLLSLHPAASGRVYAAYGGIYVAVALIWLALVDRVPIGKWDLVGGAMMIAGASIIVLANWRSM